MSARCKTGTARTDTRMARSSQLDDVDRWLLANDPELSRTTMRALVNRRIRQRHAQGGELLEDVAAEDSLSRSNVADSDVDRLVRLAPRSIRKLVALRVEFPAASQADLARMLGCSRQAVSKKRKRLLSYLEAMASSPPSQTSGSVTAAPCFKEPNGQLAWDFVDYE
ncbi:hypothetical protein AAE485_10275 [Acidithiobacillus ferriphilus]|uniref:hypothetical protein n=1 Tax=Acidithiobacillus ferriphilus TaxID=1689834 RepID=UPI00390C97B8